MDEINYVLSEIKSEIQKYFSDEEYYRDIYVSDINIEHIKIKNKIDKVEIKISFNKLFEKYEIHDEDLIQRYKRILNRLKHSCDDWFWELSANNCYMDEKNKNLETWYNKSTLYEYRGMIGFHNIRGKKAEFIMEESRTIPRDQDGNLLKKGLTLEFNIDNINIKISNPSPIFKLIFKRFINWGWEYFKTIKLENVNRKPLEDYLQQALFINNLYNQVDGEALIKFGV
ncbi:hypothetical protein [Clostridium sp. YIM B02569]|uniref:hypothetical protein n=1 Tax=Clostridium sp. YIM B02569 TaxID=2911967 RepID=UPI001EEE1DDD|nr:hypothetical protein [Clostridium sp. YIM B02569]